MRRRGLALIAAAAIAWIAAPHVSGADPRVSAADPPHPVLTWVKQHPREGAAKPSPRMGYETSYGYDPVSRLLVRYAGHNQGGGGEQNAEVWTYDLDQDVWTLKEPNDAPPGVCCAQQNVFDDAGGRFVRFPAFSGSHGWQSYREIRLKDSSVWTYDVATNTWRPMRPSSGPMPHGLRGAAYDPHHQVTVIHGGEGANYGTCVYDLYANTWTAMDPPAPRPESSLSQPGFTYDAVHRVFVLFGSQFDDDERTWAYDLRKNAWRVLEAGRPPANREKEASPVLAADTRSGIVLCSIRRAGAHETWALDAAKPAWTRLNLEREPDPSGSRNRVLVYLEDRNLFFLENNTPGGDRGKREQQVWTFRWAEAPAPPRAVALTVTTEEKAARLTWETPRDGPVTAWNVYRGEGARPWEVALQRLAEGVKGDTFRDTGLARGATCFYQVRPVDASGKEGPPSRLGRTQPPVPALDLVVSVVGAKRVDLAWEKSPAEDVVGYHVERADAAVYASAQVRRIAERYRTAEDAVGAVRALGAFRRLTASPLAAPAYVDDTADLAAPPRQPAEPLTLDRPLHKDQVVADGKPYGRAVYAYRVVAVNRLGAESGPSPWRLTIPGAPQHVFAKEEGKAAARLKWQPRPEKGLKGYHVYRHDGRYDKEPIVRLTAEPVQATEFVDEAAGAGTRRYEVAAVDALGQVGEPSQPVWSRREWRAFYVPYTGEWHQ